MLRYFRAYSAMNPWLQLLLFGVLTAGSVIIFSFLGQFIAILLYGFNNYQAALEYLANPSDADGLVVTRVTVTILAITQMTSQAGLFIIPPLLFVWLLYGPAFTPGILQVNRWPQLFTILMTIAALALSLPLIAWLTELNMAMPLPPALMRAEEDAALIVQLFFDDAGIKRFIMNMFMVAIIPAIGEELFFRGIIQTWFIRGMRNVHLAVISSAFIFSFFHFQFHGFIPRMLLGMVFGYLLVWSGSLWVPIIAHLINNGAAVVVEFLARNGVLKQGYQEFGYNTEPRAVIFSVFALAAIAFLIWYSEGNIRHKKKPGNQPGS
ncbi:MAG: type II CAAX endopeptidase family protein [Bacteroidales bacterium]